MRLTLRTLLAYLDDVLDPADKEALGKKIESSEFAEDLVHRTKDTMRRLRLSAPQVIGTGMGLDPNSVAEYLDNVMSPESVGDFERICLESDMHLAEVASCHHVLTMVLGQPADIDPAAKQRMYMIPAELSERKQVRVEPAHEAVAGQAIAAPQPASGAAPPVVPERHVEVPEYLRASGRARFRSALLGLAALVLVAATLWFFGGLKGWFGGDAAPVASGLPLGDLGAPPPTTLTPPPTDTAPVDTAPLASELQQSAPAFIRPDGKDSTAGPRYSDAAGRTTGEPAGVGDDVARSEDAQRYPESPTIENAPNPYAVSPSATTTAPTPESPPYAPIPQETSGASEPMANVSQNTASLPTPAPPATSLPDEMTLPGATTPSEVSVDPDGTVRIGASERATDAGSFAADATETVDLETPKIVELGTYRGGKTVLLRYDDGAGTWLRVSPRSAVVKSERLLALPEFRPMIALANGVHMDVLGGTELSLGAAESVELPTINVAYGRIVLINTLNEERPVQLVLGSTTAEARLAQNATLAIELERKYVPGNDPRKTPAPQVARIYVPDGGVVWQDASGATTIDKASEWTIADGESTAVVASAAVPDWIDQEAAQSSEQRYGAPVVDTTLVGDRPIDVQLLELFQGSRQREVKSLVARSGMHVGLYVPFIEALRDSGQRPNWTSHIESLRSAMAMSPKSAEKIRQALVEQRGEMAAADLYEMLCGYSPDQIGHTPEQLKTGAVARLIDWLDKDSLDYRVLAVHDLWEITGKQLMPNPAGTASDRARNIKQWRLRLEEGDVTPVTAE